VEADGGDASLRDRRLDAEVAHGGEDLRLGGRRGHRERRRAADRGRALAVEGGQREGCDGEHGEHRAGRDLARASLCATPVGTQPGSVP
jgi:hypothetical protein